MFNKIKEFLFGKKEEKVEIKNHISPDFIGDNPETMKEGTITPLDKFDAEFHNPRLQCFYCGELIESGKIRFFKAPNQAETGAYHKRCFKKLKEGKLPGQ